MKRFAWITLLVLILLLAGCGYSMTNSRTGDTAAGKKIWVPFFANESISPTAQTVLRRVFYEELHALRGLKPADSLADADLYMNARLITLSTGAVTYNILDQAHDYVVRLDVEAEIYRHGNSSPFWKGQLQGSKQFPANADLSLQRNAEEYALENAARLIAHRFISALEESY